MAPSLKRPRLTRKAFLSKAEALERIATLHGAVFEDDTPQKRATRRAKAMLHPESFDVDYLPHYFSGPPAAFHSALYDIISTVRLAAVEAPRGHAKSTTITFAYSVRQLAIAAAVKAWNEGRLEDEDRLLFDAVRHELHVEGRSVVEELRYDPFIVVGSCTSDQAVDFTTAIKLELEQNPRIIGDWGELIEDPGKNYADFVTRADCRCIAVGMRDSRRGLKHRQWRPTLWIIDDPDDEKTIGSERIRRKQIKYVTGMVRPAMDPNIGRVFIIANETHVECVVATIYRDQEKPPNEQRFKAWEKFRWQAIGDDESILWPERFTRAFLEELRNEDPEAFETEYQNNPPSVAERPFPVLQYYSREKYEGQKLPKVGVLDPSLGKKQTSDFQALIYLRWSPKDGKVLVHRAYFLRLPPPDLVVRVNESYAEEAPDAFVVEAIGFQLLLEAMLTADGIATGLFPAYETIESQTESKDVRITSLAPMVRNGVILFPDDGSCRQLERQFLAYPDGKKDGPDAVEMGMRRVRRFSRGSAVAHIRHTPRRAAQFGAGGW